MRALIVGGGARGLALAKRLRERGDAARIVTRKPERRGEIEAIGAEYLDGDPDRIGTLRYACENVTILVWALGTAAGDDPEKVRALHGSRLNMMLERTIDTTVRGVVYEAAGPLPAELYASGLREIRRANERNEVPFAVLDADPREPAVWRPAARAARTSMLRRW